MSYTGVSFIPSDGQNHCQYSLSVHTELTLVTDYILRWFAHPVPSEPDLEWLYWSRTMCYD